jgi:hypothetical protein
MSSVLVGVIREKRLQSLTFPSSSFKMPVLCPLVIFVMELMEIYSGDLRWARETHRRSVGRGGRKKVANI